MPTPAVPRLMIVSTSLNPESRSRVLARAVVDRLEARHAATCQYLDLAGLALPTVTGCAADDTPAVLDLRQQVLANDGLLIASPVYNYDVGSNAKAFVELVGKALVQKVVGFAVAAGGPGSYMAVMSLANSLMLDFRSVIVPRFVYATRDDFAGGQVSSPKIQSRLDELASELARMSLALRRPA